MGTARLTRLRPPRNHEHSSEVDGCRAAGHAIEHVRIIERNVLPGGELDHLVSRGATDECRDVVELGRAVPAQLGYAVFPDRRTAMRIASRVSEPAQPWQQQPTGLRGREEAPFAKLATLREEELRKRSQAYTGTGVGPEGAHHYINPMQSMEGLTVEVLTRS